MSSANIGNLNVQLNLEVGRLQAQIDSANNRIKRMSTGMSRDISAASRVIVSSFNAFKAALPIAGVGALAKAVIDTGGRINDLSAQVGIGVEEFQALANTFELSGVDAQTFANSMLTLRRNMQDAVEGNKGLRDSFEGLGLSVDYLKKLAPERQLEAIARAIVASKNPAAAYNDVLELMGTKNAPKLMEALKLLGTDGFDALKEKQKGSIISAEQIAIIDEAGDKLTQMKNQLLAMASKAFVVTLNFVSNDLTAGGSIGEKDPVEAARKLNAWHRQKFGEDHPLTKRSSRELTEITQANLRDDPREARVGESVANVSKLQLELQAREIARKKDESADAANKARMAKNAEKASAEAREMWEKDQATFEKIRRETEAKFAKIEEDGVARSVELQEQKAEAYRKIMMEITEEAGNAVEEEIKKQERLAESIARMWENIADRASDRLTEMILDGKASFKDFTAEIGRMIAQMLIRMAIINPIINSIGGFFGAPASSSLPSFYADGGRPKMGELAVVGEEGPELFVPDSAGTIIPHGKSMQMMSGGGGGSTYYIDASGADAGKIEELKTMIKALNGSIEPRSLAAYRDARNRGKM